MNMELGRRVLDHVTAHRDQFDMTLWGGSDSECGTVACLAGWAMLLSGYQIRGGDQFVRPNGSDVPEGGEGEEATVLLGLSHVERYGTDEDECSLFSEWDEDTAIERFRALMDGPEPAPAAAGTEE